MRWALAAALTVPAAVGAGCGGATSNPATGVAPALTDASHLRLPLDRYLLTPHDADLVARAHRVLLRRCEQRFGITGPPEPPATAGPRTLNERRYGITDRALAATAGFRVSANGPVTVPKPTEPADPRTLDVLSGEGRRVVDGQPVPPGGCSGEAKRRLGAGAPAGADRFLAERLSRDSYFRAESDRRVQAAMRAWSICMQEHGFTYPTPLAAAADPRFRAGPVTPTEIATATTDIDCKARANLVGVWSTLEADLQRPAIATHRDALDTLLRANDAELRVVRGLDLR
ncbi:hypothetical protein [Frankia sp. AgB32]|uniref:hypothetical protein n=1 Tax=Frankia sp. AgB32 TaxID=631119 RepID=UPI00200FD3ED|nr:hypothetical protein [Frankia sp. AgB32]MCK9895322.1 hypothetical protein [Frankia sp. AgB32]